MLLSRETLLRQTGATEPELRELERERFVVPVRTWKSLWLTRHYTPDYIDVVRWLLTARRAERQTLVRERELFDGT